MSKFRNGESAAGSNCDAFSVKLSDRSLDRPVQVKGSEPGSARQARELDGPTPYRGGPSWSAIKESAPVAAPS